MLSLGMVGALSIVRFRTADQGTHGYCFPVLGHCGGHCAGGGPDSAGGIRQYLHWGGAVCFFQKKTVDSPYILVVHCENNEIEEQARIFVKSQVRRLNLKSKSVDGGCVELNYEVRLKEDSSTFVNELEAMPGVSRVVLVSYNGDYMG